MSSNERIVFCVSTSYPLGTDDLNGPFVKRLNELFLSHRSAQLSRVIVLCFDRRAKPNSPTKISQMTPRQNQDFIEQVLPLSQLADLPKLISSRLNMIIITVPSFGKSLEIGAPDSLSTSPFTSSFSLALNMCRLWQAYRKVKKKLGKLNINTIVMAHWLIPSALLTHQDSPIVYCHGGDIALLESLPFNRYLTKYLIQRIQSVVCVSSDLRDRLLALLPDEINESKPDSPNESEVRKAIRVIPMGIEKPVPCLSYKAMLKEQTSRFIVITTVGRLVRIKGYDILAEALISLPTKYQEQVIWCMAGDGPERTDLVNLVRNHDINYMELGQLDSAQRDALLAVSNLFVAPSRRLGKRVEGTPLSLREAALNACPIMASDLGGVATLLNELPPESLYRIEPTVQSVVRALCQFIEDYNKGVCRKVMLSSMKEKAKELWTWEALAKAHIQVLNDNDSRP